MELLLPSRCVGSGAVCCLQRIQRIMPGIWGGASCLFHSRAPEWLEGGGSETGSSQGAGHRSGWRREPPFLPSFLKEGKCFTIISICLKCPCLPAHQRCLHHAWGRFLTWHGIWPAPSPSASFQFPCHHYHFQRCQCFHL